MIPQFNDESFFSRCLGWLTNQKQETPHRHVGEWGGKDDPIHLLYLCHMALHLLSEDRVLQINSGDGVFLLKVAAKYPNILFFGIQESNFLRSLSNLRATELGLKNIYFINENELNGLGYRFSMILNMSAYQDTTAQKTSIVVQDYLESSGIYFKAQYDHQRGLFLIDTEKKPRASFFRRKKIYHLPLRKISLKSFFKFLKIKMLHTKIQ